ncbi:hypothetical protein AALO_G00188920 [Alosa alosa]|uniref:Uncharacterized protein n=1 Tax=Alosa alosa TaxID=278164 RepID=A0AAV6G4Z8_9TELE|nr:hypothetical protein AALO_G00188920 [Alosa alosa]
MFAFTACMLPAPPAPHTYWRGGARVAQTTTDSPGSRPSPIPNPSMPSALGCQSEGILGMSFSLCLWRLLTPPHPHAPLRTSPPPRVRPREQRSSGGGMGSVFALFGMSGPRWGSPSIPVHLDSRLTLTQGALTEQLWNQSQKELKKKKKKKNQPSVLE